MKFLTGISVRGWIEIGVIATLCLMIGIAIMRGNTIDDLRGDLATEQAKHAVTRESVAALQLVVAGQNAEIERQRADAEQAKRDLAQAVAASAGSDDLIDNLTASSRAVPAGPICEPSDTVKGIWR